MQSPSVLEFDTLLAPIAGDAPTGADSRANRTHDSLYEKCKDARGEARAAEKPKSGMEGETPEIPNWQPVLDFGIRLLEEQSKDLEIATYVLEALARVYSVAGLRDGFRLVRELSELYWDDLHPQSGRLKFLSGLNGSDKGEGGLLDPISNFPMTDAKSGGDYRLSHYRDSMTIEGGSEEKRQKRIASGTLELKTLALGANNSAKEFYLTLNDDLTECLNEYSLMVKTLDEKLGADSPRMVAIKALLETYQKGILRLAGDKLKPETPAAAAQSGESATPGAAPTANVGGSDVLLSREDAFRTLTAVADYFRRTEPQGFLSYALEQVVRWGKMPLPTLLEELIADSGARGALFERVGIRPEEEPKSES